MRLAYSLGMKRVLVVLNMALLVMPALAMAQPPSRKAPAKCEGPATKTCGPGHYCRRDGCDVEAKPGHCAPRPKACGDRSLPVCGCDGVTYDNACQAAAAGFNIARSGTCESGQVGQGQSGDPTPPKKGRNRVEGCVVAEKPNGGPGVAGLRVSDVRVIAPLTVGGEGRVAVTLSDVSGDGHFAYPAVRPFSADADLGEPTQLYGIGPCARMEFVFPVRPHAKWACLGFVYTSEDVK